MTLVLVGLSLGPVQAETPASRPQAVTLDSAQGKAFVRLARSAMHEYLTRRTPADAQKIPADLSALADAKYAVAVTLREKGNVKARIVQESDSLPRNVVSAALRAMRSSALPDKVTGAVLDGLTIEVEVLGPTVDLGKDDLSTAIRPGLAGLVITRDGRSAYVLPSTEYEMAWSHVDIQAQALGNLGTLPQRWGVFTSRHFVGYPDGQAVELHRGRLVGTEQRQAPAAAAQSIAAHLLRHQDRKTGLFGTAAGPAENLLSHVWATWSMSLLAKQAPQPDLTPGIDAAIRHILSMVVVDQGRAYVAAPQPGNRVAATALLAMILADRPAKPETTELRAKLIIAMKDGLAGQGPLIADGAAAGKAALGLADRSLVYIALRRALPGDDAFVARQLPAVLRGIATDAAEMMRFEGRPPLRDLAWALRAITAGEFGPKGLYVQISSELCFWAKCKLTDALRADRGGAATLDTALWATAAGQAYPRWNLHFSSFPPQGESFTRAMEAHCRDMTYKPGEAFFAADPSEWVGAVRDAPGSAKASLRTCAAVMEAMLSQGR